MKKIFFIILSLYLLGGCKDFHSYDSKIKSRVDTLSLEEKNLLAPNPLFVSVLNKQDVENLKEILSEQNKGYLLSLNQQKDTPLGLALKTHNNKGAKYLINQMGAESLLHKNDQGESYIYLASQSGYPDLIKDISDKFYSYVFDYEFSDLDQPNTNGQKALHVAKHEGVAEALENEYYRGVLEIPFFQFSYKKNKNKENFLHTAIADNRISVLKWGLNKNCASQKQLDDYGFIYKTIYNAWNILDEYSTSFTGFEIDNLMNEKNKDGNTPLHLAAKYLSIQSIQSLLNCALIDYSLKNKEKDIPLQTFLKNLDLALEEQSQEIKDTFVSLTESTNYYSLSTIKNYVNHTNKEGDSSLHLSAKIADPFFYNYLKKYGSIVQENNEGQTPESVFNSLHEKEIK